eukprot:6215635-Amphidinium_carterae.2
MNGPAPDFGRLVLWGLWAHVSPSTISCKAKSAPFSSAESLASSGWSAAVTKRGGERRWIMESEVTKPSCRLRQQYRAME